jgi:hypothetical protein
VVVFFVVVAVFAATLLTVVVSSLAFLLNNILEVKSQKIATQPNIIIVSGNILNHIHPFTGSKVSCNLVKK